MPFDFGYQVDDEESNNKYSHASNSDGKAITGQYKVVLPNCRTQIVTYTVADDDSGFVAEVIFNSIILFKVFNPFPHRCVMKARPSTPQNLPIAIPKVPLPTANHQFTRGRMAS